MQKYKILNYNLVFVREPEGGYTVKVPSLPGCITYGGTLEEAKKMAADAIKAYITSLKKHGEDIPSDETVFISMLSVKVPSSERESHV